jgi:hypothetical protein
VIYGLDGWRRYACTQKEVFPTVWIGPVLTIKLSGWQCRFITDELVEDYEVRTITINQV